VRLRTSMAVASLAWIASAASAQVPVVTTIDSIGDVGRWNDVAMRADGRGVVAYTDATNGSLKVASCNDVACTSALLTTIDAEGPFESVAVAIAFPGHPVVSYQHVPTGSVRYAYCEDPNCSSAAVVTIEDAVSLVEGTDLVIGVDTKPFIVYGDTAGGTLKAAHCEDLNCATRTITPYPNVAGRNPAVTRGADGLPVFASQHGFDMSVGHCSNVACTSATFTRLVGFNSPTFMLFYTSPALGLGSDGRCVLAYVHNEQGIAFPNPFWDVRTRRCSDVVCPSLVDEHSVAQFNSEPAIGVAPGNRPIVSHYGAWTSPDTRLKVKRCTDPTCPSASPVVTVDAPNIGFWNAMATGPLGNALLSYYDDVNDDLKVAWLGTPPEISIGDVTVTEGDTGQTLAHLPVSLSGADSATVDFATADGSATAGLDYLSTSGTLTFTPGTSTRLVTVSVVGDLDIEGDETFRVLLSNAQGATVVDPEGIGLILDDEARLAISDESLAEGDTGSQDILFTVSLDPASTHEVRVDFTTEEVTATSGIDFEPASGTLTFTPGTTTRVVTVAVTGDYLLEPDETFRVRLSNPQGSPIEDAEGTGTILNDDAPEGPLFGELRHGMSAAGDLAANPGPEADTDDFRMAQLPYASYEIVVDAAAGETVPLTVERRASAGIVVQTGVPVGTGAAQSMRWRVAGTQPIVDESIRIAGACGIACGPDDAYRVRAYETTLTAARFNNSGTQTTVLVLQNPGTEPVSLAVAFWAPDGTLVATYAPAVPLAPSGVLVLNTSTVPGAAGTGGSLTVAHDAPYGRLLGKAVAVEPSTGFSFDTPLQPKPR